MNRKTLLVVVTFCCCLMLTGFLTSAQGANSAILGWNNLGMHCMDSDYSVFSILPPYNTIEAQLIVGGKLVKSGAGYTITYEAIADSNGSINSTSVGKGNWSQFASIIYGIPSSFTADNGLAGWNMPGLTNTPQQMKFESFNAPAPGVSTPANWFRAEGIPLTPFDDKGNKNPYPLMRIVARNASNTVIATSDIVLPVSDEMDCSACHGSATQTNAQPASGWVFAATKDRDYRLNILRLHDEHQFSQNNALYKDALAAKGFKASGLYDTAMGGKPMMCAACHSSEALGTPSFSSSNGTVPPLTSSVHTKHASVQDPVLNLTLNDSENRNACYRCHPGSATRCLRGAMGSAIAADGSMAMQCQGCHGNMSQVGSSSRVGWFMEPNCQSCHTGTATNNNGQIRYTSVFDANGQVRVPVDQTFATTPDTPAAGLSLYRFSVGHGGLQCSACHGSTHAEFPSSHSNDNIRNVELQGHGGVTIECTACHATMPTSPNGGPHGMHPVGQSWVSGHHDSIGAVGVASCKACHGADYRGTVLSRVQGDRTLNVGSGSQSFYRGATIGCYTCHLGPSNESMNTSAIPVVNDVSAQTTVGVPVTFALPVTGTGAVLRIISQPANGTVGLNKNIATYFPFDGFTGPDSFTYAAYNGAKNSRLATGKISVTSTAPPVITLNPVSKTVIAGSTVIFSVSANSSVPLSYQWYRNGAIVSGATSSSLTISAATSADAGTYYAVVINDGGSVTSKTATLTVNSDLTKPVVKTFIATTPVNTTTIPVTSFTATDNISVTGYLINEIATAPLAAATGWSATAPASYTVATAGAKTLYAWARDGAGNVSLAKKTIVTVDLTKPVVTVFTVPAAAKTLVVTVAITATDNVAVGSYQITENASAPAADSANWNTVKPASYIFAGDSTDGPKTLYAWARDKAGNVSLSKSATTTIDRTIPVVSGFSVPAIVNSLNVPVSTFNATDNINVTGYKITETSTAPLATAAGWSAVKPVSFKVARAGAKTLYAWAKDAAGNVSASASTIVNVDVTKPVVSVFSIPATVSGLIVPITTFSATDNTAVAGYKITLTSAAPLATAAGWSSDAPTSYAVPTTGAKTFYAWAKDTAGNVSLSKYAKVTVTP